MRETRQGNTHGRPRRNSADSRVGGDRVSTVEERGKSPAVGGLYGDARSAGGNQSVSAHGSWQSRNPTYSIAVVIVTITLLAATFMTWSLSRWGGW